MMQSMFIRTNSALQLLVLSATLIPEGAPRRQPYCLGPSEMGWGLTMSAWKRWSWRYRVGVLFALALLLQGANCPLHVFQQQTYAVPNAPGRVIGTWFTDENGQNYFLMEEIDSRTGARGFRRIYSNHGAYWTIFFYFMQPDFAHVLERQVIPGGVARHAPPPVQ